MLLNRRHKGWKAEELEAEFLIKPALKINFTNLVDGSIKQYLSGAQRVPDRALEPPLQTVTNRNKMLQTFTLGGYCIWPKESFALEFPTVDAVRDMKLSWVSESFPDGSAVRGWKIDDDGKRPLPRGVVPVVKQYQKEVELAVIVDDGQDTQDANQQKDNYKHQAKLRAPAMAATTLADCRDKAVSLKARDDKAQATVTEEAAASSDAVKDVAMQDREEDVDKGIMDGEYGDDSPAEATGSLKSRSAGNAGQKLGSGRSKPARSKPEP